MNRQTNTAGVRNHWARGFFALALLALGVFLLQPVCIAHEVQSDDTCCVSIADAAPPDDAASPVLLRMVPAAPVSNVTALVWHSSAPRARSSAPPGDLRACPPYHARSARNLR